MNDLAQIVFHQFGEQTHAEIMEKCYPDLQKVLMSDQVPDGRVTEEHPESARQIVREAVERERQRLPPRQPRNKAETEVGREIQSVLGAASVVANRVARAHAKKVLESRAGERGKPN